MFATQGILDGELVLRDIPPKPSYFVPILNRSLFIKARVISKSNIRLSRNNDPYFVIYLNDGSLIKAFFYNNVAFYFYSKIEKGQLYVISNFNVYANNNRSEIHFNLNSVFTPIYETFVPDSKNFLDIKNVFYISERFLVNILAIVVHVGEIMEFQEGCVKRRIVKLADTSSSVIDFVLWNDDTSLINPKYENQILEMSYAYVHIWKNHKELHYRDPTYFNIARVNHPKVQYMMQWWRENCHKIMDFTRISEIELH